MTVSISSVIIVMRERWCWTQAQTLVMDDKRILKKNANCGFNKSPTFV